MTESPIARLRDGTPVGAWLLKANPDVWDVLGAIERGEGLDRWRLAWSYRVDLVEPSHPCVLWITGPAGGHHVPGIWAVGQVSGPPTPLPDDPTDPGWGETPPRDVRPYVSVDLRVCAEPLARSVIANDPRLERIEILRRPRIGSPLVLTPAEWEVVDELTAD